MARKGKFISKGIIYFLILLSAFFIYGNSFAGEPPMALSIDNTAVALGFQSEDAIILHWRGVLIGGDHGSPDIYYDNAYIQISNGPIMYQTSMPARRLSSVQPDQGLLWHLFSRDNAGYTIYASSTNYNELSSELSEGFAIDFLYDTNGCTEQTVPVADAGMDQIVQVGSEVTLNATASYDPFEDDTSSLVYRWECYSAPEEVSLSDEGQTAVTTFTATTVGHYYFRLNVRDQVEESSFNRSPVDYLRVCVVDDPYDADLLDANAGRMQQAEIGEVVTLDGGQSRGPSGSTTYQWEQINPLGSSDLSNLSSVLGTTGCCGECYRANFDADSDVDGTDIALLAKNWGAAAITNADQSEAHFTAGIARPHIFKLTVGDGVNSVSETTIVAVNHPNVSDVLTPPPADDDCLTH